jgi:GTPase involved in cell partitioning and DNA repair
MVGAVTDRKKRRRLVIYVPLRTIVQDEATGKTLADIVEGQRHAVVGGEQAPGERPFRQLCPQDRVSMRMARQERTLPRLN